MFIFLTRPRTASADAIAAKALRDALRQENVPDYRTPEEPLQPDIPGRDCSGPLWVNSVDCRHAVGMPERGRKQPLAWSS